MKFIKTSMEGCFCIESSPIEDERGWFARYFCKKEFSQIGHTAEWVQMNQSFTLKAGAIRGMHFQHPPFSEIKLVRCIQGAVLDVVVDLRQNSQTFLKWEAFEISAENNKAIYIPKGFAHGFQCLTDNCSLLYHHSDYYNNKSEAGLRYDDPMIDIKWPLPLTIISERDAAHPFLSTDFKGV